MTIILYNTALSPPGRAVWFTAAALGIKYEHREINLSKKEQLLPDYIKMNPQHTLPLLNDNGTIIWDSHAIMTYLVDKYGKTDELYPKDLALRSQVDQRLHFDSGYVFAICRRILRPMLYFQEESIAHRLVEDMKDSLGFLELFLGDNQWMCGSKVTIADFSILSSITSLNEMIPIDGDKFPKVYAWIKRAQKEWPFYQEVQEQGLKEFREIFEVAVASVKK